MTVALLWLRLELRRRWRPLVVLAALVAVATGTVITAVAGARRGDSAVDRLLARTLPATAQVVPNQSGFDWDGIRALPEVEAVTTYPAYTSLAIDGVPDTDLTPFVAADRDGMHTIERPVVLDGRLADPARPDEAVVTARFVETSGRGVGDVLRLHLLTPEQADANLVTRDVGPPNGPVVPLHIVGVVRSLWYGDPVDGRGRVIPSAGLLASYRANLLGASGAVPLNGLVRLRAGSADLPTFQEHLASLSGRPDIDVVDRATAVDHARDVTRFEAGCLFAFALAVSIAGLVVVGQALIRHAAASTAELRTLVAMGMTTGQGIVAAAAGPVLAGLAGAGAGVAAAVVASRWMPFGAAATYEPDPGVHADSPVLVLGALIVLALLTATAALATRSGLARPRARTARRRVRVARAAFRMGVSVPVAIGTWFALEPDRDRDHAGLPVRATLVSLAVGILGTVAALTFSAGVADASSHPERFGRTYQLQAIFGFGGQDFTPPGPALDRLAADADVRGVTNLRVAAGDSRGNTVTAHTYDPVGAPVPLVLLRGRAPLTADEIVLSPTTADQLGATDGSTVPLRGDRGERMLRVVGIGFAVQSSTSSYDRGAWITPASYDGLFTGFKEHAALIALRPGADPGDVVRRFQPSEDPDGAGLLIIEPFDPPQFGEIQDVRRLPLVVAALLAVLAAGATLHALVSSVRRRRHDLAILRVQGMTRQQARTVVVVQGTVVTVIGLVVGVPLGIALGRSLWRVAADQTPLQYHAPLAPLALALVAPVALVVVTALGAWPSRAASRLRIGDVLRGE